MTESALTHYVMAKLCNLFYLFGISEDSELTGNDDKHEDESRWVMVEMRRHTSPNTYCTISNGSAGGVTWDRVDEFREPASGCVT